jgi:hypothetical protein
MKSYLYHPEFLYYMGEEEAPESPLEPGIFLHASNGTEKEPNFSMTDKFPYFIDGEWVLRDTQKNNIASPTTQVSMAGDYIPYAISKNDERAELVASGFSEEEADKILGINNEQ